MGFHQLYSGNNSWDNYIMRYCDQVMLAGFSGPHCIARSMFFACTQQLHYCSSKPTLLSMGKKTSCICQDPTFCPANRRSSWYFFPIFSFSEPCFFRSSFRQLIIFQWTRKTLWHQRIVPYLLAPFWWKNPMEVAIFQDFDAVMVFTLGKSSQKTIWGFPKSGYPNSWMVDICWYGKNDLQMDDEQGSPPFLGKPPYHGILRRNMRIHLEIKTGIWTSKRRGLLPESYGHKKATKKMPIIVLGKL